MSRLWQSLPEKTTISVGGLPPVCRGDQYRRAGDEQSVSPADAAARAVLLPPPRPGDLRQL
ncbi:MAG: hypothetical protein ACR2IJ_04055 [Fluviibacter sp.]